MSSYYLFLDDIRHVKDVTWVELPTVKKWFIVRNYDEFTHLIEKKGLPEFISFDHDLAEEHYNDSMMLFQDPYHSFKEQTGADCARWLTDYCYDLNLDLPKYQIHSMNSIGGANIKSILESYKKSRQ